MGVSAGGGLKTTALDLSNYLIMHANGGVYNGVRILSEDSVEEIHKKQYPDSYDGICRHGFGWYSWIKNDTGEEFGGHMGGYRGAQALMHLRYSDNVGVIMLWNQNSNFLNKIGISRVQEKEARKEIERKLFEKADEL
jgi:CubicO group peptidase (beta-lactamase class C family)